MGQSDLTDSCGDLRQAVSDEEFTLGRTWDVQLALALLEATSGLGLKSPFWDVQYTSLLPKPEVVSSSIPFCMAPADLHEQPEAIREAAQKQKERLRNIGITHDPAGHRVTALAESRLGDASHVVTPLEWAFACVRSRVFNGADQKGDSGGCFALVPVIDSCNHSFDPNCEFERDQESESFRLVALRDIEDGAECTICYGNHDNSRLLKQYGFTVEGNPFGAHV